MRYDYWCERCEVTIELNVPVDERDGQICPHCHHPLKRLLSCPYIRIPRAFRMRPDWELMLTPAGRPIKFNVPRKELEREFWKEVEKSFSKEVPEHVQRQLELEEKTMKAFEEVFESQRTDENEEG